MIINTHPQLKLKDDWYRFELIEPWTYRWRYLNDSIRQLYIPKGFDTDLASVPKVIRFWIGREELRAASIPHDFLTRYGGHIPYPYFMIDGEPCVIPWTRLQADKLFARMMRETGKISKVKRRAAFIAVRLGGWKAWNEGLKRINKNASG